MNTRPQMTVEDLHAFIDGELDRARHEQIASAIAEDAELQRQVSTFQSDKLRLAQLYGRLLQEPIPEKWVDRIEAEGSATRRSRFSARAMMALAATLLLDRKSVV